MDLHIKRGACKLGMAFCMLPAASVFAAQAVLGEETDGFSDLPVVLTASRLQQSVAESPSAVTVIDRDLIEKSGARQIADLMRFVPGAIVGYNDGNRPVVTLRSGMSGVYASGVQVLIDGVSVYSPLWGGMQWEELPIAVSDVERIEVIRGPNAAIFGPNSFLGVINIITREPAADSGGRIEGRMGDGGIADGTMRYAGGAGGWRYRTTVGQRASDGFDTRPDKQRYVFGNVRVEYRVDHSDAISVTARWANNRKDLGDYAERGVSNQYPHTSYGHSADIQVRWTRAQSADDELWVQYYHHQGATQDRVSIDARLQIDRVLTGSPFLLPKGTAFVWFPSPLPYLVDIDYTVVRDGLELQHTRRWSERLRSVWGLETRRDGVASTRLFGVGDEQAAFLTRGFVNVEWKWADRWTLHGATMIERNTNAKTAWSPKVALTYEPYSGHVFRVGSSRAQRTPTLYEKKANYYFDTPPFASPVPPFVVIPPARLQLQLSRGGPNSESILSNEIGYAFSLPNTRLNGDMRWFFDRLNGLAGQVNRGGITVINMDDLYLRGGDLTLNWLPQAGTRLRLAVSKTKMYANDQGGSYSKSTPDNTVSLFWGQALAEGMEFSANYQRVGAMFWTDAGSPKRAIAPIDHLDLRLAKEYRLGATRTEMALVVQEALGNHREYYVSTPNTVSGRLVSAQLSLDF